MSTRELATQNMAQAPSITDALSAVLSDDAIDYINERGAEVGALSAMELKLVQKARKLKEKIDASPEAQQLKTIKGKLKQVKDKRSETVTKIAGVIEKELGPKADQAVDQLFGETPKALNGR